MQLQVYLVLLLLFGLTSAVVKDYDDNINRCDKDNCDKYNFDPIFDIDESLNDLEQDDPKLIKVLKEKFLSPPSTEPYNFTKKTGLDLTGQYKQALFVDEMLGQKKKKGFFIEAGAFDGEHLSNSLRFELLHQWTGLLVEPNPAVFKELRYKHRRAWTFPNCFSTKTTPETVEFDAAGLVGGIINPENPDAKPADLEAEYLSKERLELLNKNRKTVKVQCFPVYSVLLALDNPTVHYFTLDIEGAELQVLKTIPFDKVDIKILDIEVNHLGQIFAGKKRQLQKLLTKAGYHFHTPISIDEIWVKNDFEYFGRKEWNIQEEL